MHEKVELSGITKQIMPGPSGDLEEWQTLEASGDIDLLGLPFLKVTLEPRHYLYNGPIAIGRSTDADMGGGGMQTPCSLADRGWASADRSLGAARSSWIPAIVHAVPLKLLKIQ